MMVWQMAARNLLRNRWRSGLSIAGIAVATAILIWNYGFFDGFFDLMVRGTTEVDIGHVQLQDERYIDQPATYDYFAWDEELQDTVSSTAGVEAVAPRVRLFGLIGHEERSSVARILGVDPKEEPRVTVMAEGVRQGRWLGEEAPKQGAAEVVIGRGLSQSLGVGVGDELVVIAEGADGSMGDGLLEVVGILETGNSRIDRRAALLHLEEAQFIAAVEGAVHEAILRVDNPGSAPVLADELQRRLDAIDRSQVRARSWQEVEPGLYELLIYGDQMNRVIFLIVFFVVALGVLNTLRMSTVERHREFGVMRAVGMSKPRLFWLVSAEGALLGFIGAAVGGVVGAAATYFHATAGLDLSPFVEGDATWMGVSFAERIYFIMTWKTVLYPVMGLVVVSTLCAVWPAVTAIRLNVQEAISGRT